MSSWVKAEGDGWLLSLHIQPGARKTEIAGLYDGALKLRLAAPPVDGKANEALLHYLAERLGLPRRALELKSGATSRRKLVRVNGGCDPAALLSA
ncbi:DUF167 domain-containing protein [Chitinolyticbacter meiyuanensis]|uniref:DUF167 domain-containing protein n=1 Tax=Chitinolyticbacter meiyuanensis TaxID=682798 RepID=UPI0011E58A96|nr:DUF167 domain-containing protein [Chitinolyticbacter meiyuanensis]